MDWSEPRNVKEWLRRVFSLRPVALFLLVLAVFISELRFDWIEQSVGAYLVTTNSRRPQSGAIWEAGERTKTARQTLEQILTDREASQREARDATTFTQILSTISPEQGVMLSSEHFRKLYLSLPGEIAGEIVTPFELLGLSSNGQWVRTFLKSEGAGLKIYLLNAKNRVMKELAIPYSLLRRIEPHDTASTETLDDLPTFENRIYSAERFFSALKSLPDADLRSIVPQPERLLETPGHIVRVGISDETVSGFIELGFEIEEGTRRKVLLVRGREWAVWLLHSHLKEKDVDAKHGTERQGNRIPR